jgi:hypothetical protein
MDFAPLNPPCVPNSIFMQNNPMQSRIPRQEHP